MVIQLYSLMWMFMNSLTSCYEAKTAAITCHHSIQCRRGEGGEALPRIRAIKHHNVLLLEQRMPALTQRLNLLRVGHKKNYFTKKNEWYIIIHIRTHYNTLQNWTCVICQCNSRICKLTYCLQLDNKSEHAFRKLLFVQPMLLLQLWQITSKGAED